MTNSGSSVLVLGCGLVSSPLIVYLSQVANAHVTIATRSVSKAAVYEDSPNISVVQYDIETDLADNLEALRTLVSSVQVVVSLLPYIHHVPAAKVALELKKHFCTTSYISDEMMLLDEQFKAAGLTCLNEAGVDPGLDHMSAMAVIHRARNSYPCARILSFQSLCGGLPSVEANNNPLGYKLSWSPRGVLLAGRNSARVLLRGREVNVDGSELFSAENVFEDSVDTVGSLEWYFNRDSIKYADVYSIPEAKTVVRGTYRFPGWSRLLHAISQVRLNSLEEMELEGCTYSSMVLKLLGMDSGNAKKAMAKTLQIDVEDDVIERLDWLGVFSESKIPEGISCPLDALCSLMEKKMKYGKGENDMIVMKHQFEVQFSNTFRRTLTSSLVNVGLVSEGGDTAMARTVALPLAVAVHALLESRIVVRGVIRPVIPEVYEPVLAAMRTLGVSFQEETLPPSIWLRHEVKNGEARAAITPETVAVLVKSGFRVTVERSSTRCFPDVAYEEAGAQLARPGEWTSAPYSAIIVGLKELPEEPVLLEHAHVFFAHAFKEQVGWQSTLRRFSQGGGHLWDLEFLVDDSGRRVAAFGRAAGIVGMALGLKSWAASAGERRLGSLNPYESVSSFAEEVKSELALANSESLKVIVLGARGRCGSGAVYMAEQCGLNATQIVQWDIEETRGGGPFPELLDFDIIINTVYLTGKVQPFLNQGMLRSEPERRLSVVVDVSCDFTSPNNPLPIYSEGTSFDEPVLSLEYAGKDLSIIAIDHLPSLIPVESSTEFSEAMQPYLLQLDRPDESPVWSRAAKVFDEKVSTLPSQSL